MADEKPQTGCCGPSQVTINIGTSGVKINDEGKPGEHVSAELRVKPTADPKATGLWAPRIQAPAAGFVVHGVSVDYIENPD